MASGELDAVVTAHTLDDQAETVLAKLLRGAWTEGLAGIAPRLRNTRRCGFATAAQNHTRRGRGLSRRTRPNLVRGFFKSPPLLYAQPDPPRTAATSRSLEPTPAGEHGAGGAPPWRATKRPGGPRSWLVLPRRSFFPVVRCVVEGVPQAAVLPPSQALDVTRLAALAPALQRRLLRFAAAQLGAAPDFEATEALRALSLTGRAGQKLELAQGLRAERTPRELRLSAGPAEPLSDAGGLPPEYRGTIPGQIDAAAFGLSLRIDICPSSGPSGGQGTVSGGPQVTLRNWRPGDRVTLRYSGWPQKS